MTEGTNLLLELPEKLIFLHHEFRYKVAYGGRGSAKSWSYARMLLNKGMERSCRIICAREVQKSIKDSVHKLLSDQIERLSLGYFYEVYDQSIRGRNGTEFAFSGLAAHTVESIKSFEGADYCWVEEGQTVSKRSWDILIPTIRKDNSEVWVTFNPDLDTDDTYRRFVTNTPHGCKSVEVNWMDNPWFNKVMNDERLTCKRDDPENYDNIWGGKCRPAVEGAIFFKEITLAQNEGRVCNVPYDPMLLVHVVVDLGNLDHMFIALVQKHSSEIRIIEAIQGGCRSIPEYSMELKKKPYNWGKFWLPHDGFSVSRQTGKSDDQVLRALGWDVPRRNEITELGLEAGIRVARMASHRVYIDKVKADPLVESLKRYRRAVNRNTEAEGSPLADHYAHGGDTYRYVCVNIENMTNHIEKEFTPIMAAVRPLDPIVGM